MLSTRAPLVLLVAVSAAATSCRSPSYTGNPVLVDPDRVSSELGSSEELRQVSQQTVTAFLGCRQLDPNTRYRVVLGEIVNQTGLRDYDERILYNRLLSQLVNTDSNRFVFLDRGAVAAERRAQAEGAVAATEGVERPLTGADLILTIELRSLLGARTQTIQYDFKLTKLDGEIVCTYAPPEIKKRV